MESKDQAQPFDGTHIQANSSMQIDQNQSADASTKKSQHSQKQVENQGSTQESAGSNQNAASINLKNSPTQNQMSQETDKNNKDDARMASSSPVGNRALNSEEQMIFEYYTGDQEPSSQTSQGKVKMRPREAFTNLQDANKKLKLDPLIPSSKEFIFKTSQATELFKELEQVYSLMSDFNSKLNRKEFPDKVCLINKQWFDSWKQRVNYDKYAKHIESKQQFCSKPQPATQNATQTTQLSKSFFGNWQSNNLLAGSSSKPLSLGDKLQQEKEFNEKKKEQEMVQLSVENTETKLTPESLFGETIIEIGPIENHKLLKPFEQYLRSSDSLSNQDVALKNGFTLNQDGIMVPTEVFEILGSRYGVDIPIIRERNLKSEAWQTMVSTKYILSYEEVRLLVLEHLVEPDENIHVLDWKGDNIKKPMMFSQASTVNAPPVPQNGAKLPPLPTTGGVPTPPLPGVGMGIPNPPSQIALPPLPGNVPLPPQIPAFPLPPVPVQTKFPFRLIQKSIYVCPDEKLYNIKARIADALGLKETTFRLWMHENSWSEYFDKISEDLAKHLKSLTYSQEKLADTSDDGGIIESNSGAIFPGRTLEIILHKQVNDFNAKEGGKLCTTKGIIFIETVNASGNFTFKYSMNKDHYIKCKYFGCNKTGLLDKFPCVCNKVTYCSEACRDKDQAHINECLEAQKKLYDPKNIDFTVSETPRNGVVGLNNLGNTCYMNSALQCLSNTPELVNYFCRLALFKEELNQNNALASKNNQIAVLFAKFLHQMWNAPKTSFSQVFNPAELKRAIAAENALFQGYSQHDSNELVQFMLDQLHEDLNRVVIKPILSELTNQQLQQYADPDLAMIFKEMHLSRNQSVICDLIYGTFKSTIVCQECKIQSRKFQSFLTLPVQITTQSFDLKYAFVPFLPSEKIFMHTLKGLSTTQEILDGQSSLNLYWLKKKVCEVANYFYSKDVHTDPKSKQKLRFQLTFQDEQPVSDYNPLTPFDIMIASIKLPNANNSACQFTKIFGDHTHTLLDIQSQLVVGEQICFFQIDPNAVDRHKISSMEDKQHLLKFPEYLKQDYIIAPCEVLTMIRPEDESNLDDLSNFGVNFLSPRFACINLKWAFTDLHKNVLSVFLHAIENKQASKYNNYGQNTYSKGFQQQKKLKKQTPKMNYYDDEYEMNHDLSDDDNKPLYDDDQIDSLHYGYQNSVNYYIPPKHFTYQELFNVLLQYRQYSGKWPNLQQLDAQKGELVQPLSLNLVSHSRVWHVPLQDQFMVGQLFTTLVDQNTSKGCNDYMFKDPNPEQQKQHQSPQGGKNKLIKLQVIYNIKQMPQQVYEVNISQKFWPTIDYQREFVFDKHCRIVQTKLGQDTEMMSSSSSSFNEIVAKECTLDSCLASMSKEDLLHGDNAYDCETCKQKCRALKKMELYEVPPILILTLQRFKNGFKNNDLVKFPIAGLDMQKFTISDQFAHPAFYDLYAVINHSGTLGFGHYTATCFNQAEQQWLHYNDSLVNPVTGVHAQNIITSQAYVLFYKRRGFSLKSKEDFESVRIKPLIQNLHQEVEPMTNASSSNLLAQAQNATLEDMQMLQIIQNQEIDVEEDKPMTQIIDEDIGPGSPPESAGQMSDQDPSSNNSENENEKED